MVREGIILTKLEASDIFLILSNARLKCTGKFKTAAEKYHQKFEEVILCDLEKYKESGS